MKRARDARLPKHLGREGILVLGHQEQDPLVAQSLQLPVPDKGEFISVRVHPAAGSLGTPGVAEINGQPWRIADSSDPVVEAPQVARAARRQ